MRVTIGFGSRYYYREITIVGLENLQQHGPQIVVSNHPNTVMDALHVARLTKEQSFFLVNYSMFKNPITNFIFRTLYCIPIRRREDVQPDESIDNTEGFSQCDVFLRGGGTLFIAPEGSSYLDWKLRPLKTGTARIAFSAMKDNDLPFHIVPVGLTYFDGHQFGGALYLEAGTPIDVRPFMSAYEANPSTAYETLTAYISEQMRPLMLDTTDKAQETLLYHFDKLLGLENLPLEARYLQLSRWIETIKQLAIEQPEKYASLTETAETYAQTLMSQGVSHQNTASGVPTVFRKSINIVTLILLLPLSIYGWTQHLFAVGLPLLGIYLTKPYIGYYSAFKFGMGYFTFPLFYMIQTLAVWYFTHNGLTALTYLVTLPVFGFIADWHTTAVKTWMQNSRWSILQKTQPAITKTLEEQARTIVYGIANIQN